MSRRREEDDKPSLVLFVLGVLFLPVTLVILVLRMFINKRKDDWS